MTGNSGRWFLETGQITLGVGPFFHILTDLNFIYSQKAGSGGMGGPGEAPGDGGSLFPAGLAKTGWLKENERS